MKGFLSLISNKYKNWSISFKLLSGTAFLILFSVFFVSILSYFQYTGDSRDQSAARDQQIIDQAALNIDTYFDDLFRLSASPYYYDNVIESLEQDVRDSDIMQLDKTRFIEGFLDQMMIIPRNDILRVMIMTDDIYMSARIRTGLDKTTDFHDFDWYKSALESREPVFVPAHLEDLVKNPRNIVFSVVNQLRSTRDTEKILGVIKVDANFSGIESICSKIDMGKNGGLFIIDENNSIIYSSINTIPYLEFYNKAKDLKGQYSTITNGSMPYMLNSSLIPRSNWTIVSVCSIDEINENARKIRNNALLLAIACSIFAIFVLTIFIKNFLRPLMDIVKLMKEVQKGNLSVKFPVKRKDEIGYLGSSFNAMVEKARDMIDENTELVKEVYEAEYLQKEAQVNSLFSQIRPHFIYNTLNMISMLVQCGKSDAAVENINKLSSILRGMANMDKDISVREEIKLLDSYLSLQRSRYGERLEYSIHIDEYLHSYMIPSLILQPAVENAVIHGCEAKKDKTTIKIYNVDEDDVITFVIEDDGAGMDEKQLFEIRSKIGSPISGKESVIDSGKLSSGIGLVNISRRIKIRYGREYGISLDSSPGKGTKVRIILPKYKLKGDM